MNKENTKRMVEVGIKRISLSIDGADAAAHDAFRNVPGAFDAVIKATQLARDAGLEFQINTTITKHNINELPKILELAMKLGAVAYHPFYLCRPDVRQIWLIRRFHPMIMKRP